MPDVTYFTDLGACHTLLIAILFRYSTVSLSVCVPFFCEKTFNSCGIKMLESVAFWTYTFRGYEGQNNCGRVSNCPAVFVLSRILVGDKSPSSHLGTRSPPIQPSFPECDLNEAAARQTLRVWLSRHQVS
jgi:hypothetical protein